MILLSLKISKKYFKEMMYVGNYWKLNAVSLTSRVPINFTQRSRSKKSYLPLAKGEGKPVQSFLLMYIFY